MKQTTQKLKMELLAPAGTIESFCEAIDAGANAVYCGLTEFSARMRARNFTMKTLAYAVPYAHARQVKVYVAFNTLVKQSELERAVHVLYQLEQIGVDAIIVQDLGIMQIAKKLFPALRLHASTQLAVHNSAGVEACSKLGIKRVVLARELTLAEIASACSASATKLEVEVFVHGALCYSLSGMCLGSSFFGGSSGNRGRCTQVCRRSFDFTTTDNHHEEGYYFSPNDLSAIDMLPKLAEAGVKSLKIEGRMKSPEYVRTVVRAYRMVLDDPSTTSQAKEMLRQDMGRRKTTLFLQSVTQTGIIDAINPAGTGIFIGQVESMNGLDIVIRSKTDINQGDILRVQGKSGTEGVMAGVAKCHASEGVLCITLDKEISCVAGDSLYCVGRALSAEKSEVKLSSNPIRYFEVYKNIHSQLRTLRIKESAGKNIDRRLIVKIDSRAWLPLLNKKEIGGVVCAFDTSDMHLFVKDVEIRNRLGRSGYIEPPPFIPEADSGEWRRLIQTLCKDGECGLMCNNIGHSALEPGVKRMRADYMLWCLNEASRFSLHELGLPYFTYSLEDDSMNIRDCASQSGSIYVFGHVPLFISRMQPALLPGSHISDRMGRKIVTREKHGLYYLVAEETISLFHKREKFEEAGIKTFIIDLAFMEPDEAVLDELVKCYTAQTKFPESCLFNFKGGLK